MLTSDILRTVAQFTGWRCVASMWRVCTSWNIALKSERDSIMAIEVYHSSRVFDTVTAVPERDHLLIVVRPRPPTQQNVDTEMHIHACVYAILDTLQRTAHNNDHWWDNGQLGTVARPITLLLRWNSGFVVKPHNIVNQIAKHMEHPGCRLQELDVDLRNKGAFDVASKLRFATGCVALPSLRCLNVAWDSDTTDLQWLMHLLRFAWYGRRWYHFGITLQENRSAHSAWWTGVLQQINIELQLHRVSDPEATSVLRELTLHLVGVSPRLSVVFGMLSFLHKLRTLSLSFSRCDLSLAYVCDIGWEQIEHEIQHIESVTLCCHNTCLTTSILVRMLDGFQRIGMHRSAQELVLNLECNELDHFVWKQLAGRLQEWTALRRCIVNVASNACGTPPSGLLPDTVHVLGASESRMKGRLVQTGVDDDDDASFWTECVRVNANRTWLPQPINE